MPWVYSKSGRGYDEHWHRWTARKTVKTATGYEMLERCRGCGELRTTLVQADSKSAFASAIRRSITIATSPNASPKAT